MVLSIDITKSILIRH
jgi:WD40 repeat protein